jgi:uncharacterized protein
MSCAATTNDITQSQKLGGQNLVIDDLVHEFLVVTGSKKNQEKMISLMTDQMKKAFEHSLNTMIVNQPSLSSTDKADAIMLINKTINNFVTRYRRELKEVMPYSEMEKVVYAPILTDHFSAEELKQMISFYKSPIGEKYIKLMPLIMEQSMAKTNELYFSKISKLSETIAEEEIEKLKSEIELLRVN